MVDSHRTAQALAAQQRQRTQMLLALGLLAVALIVVLIKDRQFWFPSATTSEEVSEQASQPNEPSTENSTASSTAPAQGTAAAAASAGHFAKGKHRAHPAPQHSAPPSNNEVSPTITATNRAALPPLEVEVVAGGQRQTVQPSGPSVHVDMQSGASPAATSAAAQVAPVANNQSAGPVNSGERMSVSAATSQAVERPVEPNYPMLAKQMKVQGSVILQALIGREGSIQDLRVLSGPAILSTAAMDAVRQWHFRPYYQSGQAIETEARITVNFTISTY
jgi:TonB family protein